MTKFDPIDERIDVDAAFEALKAATPACFMDDFGRMMLMGRTGTVHQFKHKDMRRGFSFDIVSGEFSGKSQAGDITSVEEAYKWARS